MGRGRPRGENSLCFEKDINNAVRVSLKLHGFQQIYFTIFAIICAFFLTNNSHMDLGILVCMFLMRIKRYLCICGMILSIKLYGIARGRNNDLGRIMITELSLVYFHTSVKSVSSKLVKSAAKDASSNLSRGLCSSTPGTHAKSNRSLPLIFQR